MKHGIVIPCYNESSRLQLDTYIRFAEAHPDTTLCFVNDGSADTTRSTLAHIKNLVSENVYVYHVEENAGKANAVRQGASFLYRETDVDTIGFLDADLSTGFDEYGELLHAIEADHSLNVVFGSRNMGGGIERNPARKLISDGVKLCIRLITRLNIADTQCGAKVFHRSLIPLIYNTPFVSRWLFDVEILLRLKKKMGKAAFLKIFLEKPLSKWVHMDGSKLDMKESLKIPASLLRIWKHYELNQINISLPKAKGTDYAANKPISQTLTTEL
ncbi:glycosyltransferase [Roseivirga sp. BDSF3-8]|uniref:glycosyltransferase n=1 Tax=Roseivirga sp. BDSF3-8 TaxID=3241598 RepID=UPI003531EAFC